MYKAHRPFTPSIHNVSSVIYGPMYTPNFVHEVYDLYSGVHGLYALYVRHTPCTGRILRVHNVSSVIYCPMYTPNFVHEVYDLYRAHA